MTTIHATALARDADDDVTPAARLLGWDCLELWVGNARTTAGFLMSAFGFACTAYAGPETGVRHKASYVLEQGDIRLVVSAALDADSPIAAHVRTHGDGVHDLALLVDDARAAYAAAVARGATPERVPWEEEDDQGVLVLAQIGTYGHTVHTFVDRSRYAGPRLEPGYHTDRLPAAPVGPPVGLTTIDHVVGNVEQGRLEDWVRFYAEVLGFAPMQKFSEGQIATEYSALASTVVWDGKRVVMPINEPASGRRKSQIQEYLEAYDGPGVQHVALRTDDIVASVDALHGARRALHGGARHLLRRGAAAPRRRRPALDRPAAPRDPGRPRQRRPPAADLHRDHHRPAGRVLRDHRAPGCRRLRRGQLQGALRGDRARPGPAGQPLSMGAGSGFGPANLPFGVARVPGHRGPRVVVALGEDAVDLLVLHRHGLLHSQVDAAVLASPTLNPLLAQGPEVWRTVRRAVGEVAEATASDLPAGALVPRSALALSVPLAVGDFVDGYGGLHHATAMGQILRPDAPALQPNWRHIPVAYHGRSGTVVGSGAPIRRPRGHVLVDGAPEYRPTDRLDFELELGYVVGTG